MEEAECPTWEVIDLLEESLDELRELESEEITASDDYKLDNQEDLCPLEEEPSAEVILTSPKKPRRTKLIIPPEATPLEIFMLEKDFHMGELASITKLSKEELLEIIRGDMPTEYQISRIRLTTGVRL